MANVTLTTANKVNVATSGPNTQVTAVAGVAITAGQPVCFDGTNDTLIVSDANDAAADALAGIATRTVAAGEALTCIRKGLMYGWGDLPVPGSLIYANDTAGTLGDTVGTASLVVGMVVPIESTALGVAADRGILVDISGIGKAA
jgi:hypothetical protein